MFEFRVDNYQTKTNKHSAVAKQFSVHYTNTYSCTQTNTYSCTQTTKCTQSTSECTNCINSILIVQVQLHVSYPNKNPLGPDPSWISEYGG
jgi:hypothetical protein